MGLLEFLFCMQAPAAAPADPAAAPSTAAELHAYVQLMSTRQLQSRAEVDAFVSDFDARAQDQAAAELAKLRAFLAGHGVAHAAAPLVDFGVESLSDFLNPLLVNGPVLHGSGVGLRDHDVQRLLAVQGATLRGEPVPPSPAAAAAAAAQTEAAEAAKKAAAGTRPASKSLAVSMFAPAEETKSEEVPAVDGARENRDGNNNIGNGGNFVGGGAGPFAVGDAVKWKGDDDDVPVGTVGRVTSIHADGDVEVAFPKRAQEEPAKKRGIFGRRKKKVPSAPAEAEITFTFLPDRIEHASMG